MQHAAPLVFKPYNARTIKTGCPILSCPNSGPAIVYTFSRAGAFKYALPISIDLISNSFNAAMRKAILTLSRVTTVE